MKRKYVLVIFAVAALLLFNLRRISSFRSSQDLSERVRAARSYPYAHIATPSAEDSSTSPPETDVGETTVDEGQGQRMSATEACDTLASLVRDSTAMLSGEMSHAVPVISMYASGASTVGVVGTHNALLLLAPIYKAHPLTLLLSDHTITPEVDFVLPTYALCQESSDASVFVPLSSLAKNEHQVDLLVIGDYDVALTMAHSGFYFCRKYLIVLVPEDSNSRWAAFSKELLAILYEEEVAEEWTVETLFPTQRMLILQRRTHVFRQLRDIDVDRPGDIQPTRVTNPRGAQYQKWWLNQDERDLMFFNLSHLEYRNFVDARALQQRFLEDSEVSRDIIARRKSELRRKIFNLHRSYNSDREELSKLDEKSLAKEERELIADAEYFEGMAEAGAVKRAAEFSLQMSRLQQKQFGGGINVDAGDASFDSFLHAPLQNDVSHCVFQAERAGCSSCSAVLCPPVADSSSRATLAMYRAVCVSTLPVAPIAPLIVALARLRCSITIIDCHPQLIAVALHAVLSRTNSAAPSSFVLVNGLSCGLGEFRNKFPKAQYAIREQGDSLPAPSDIVVLFYSSLKRFSAHETFRAKHAIFVLGMPNDEELPLAFPQQNWRLSFVSTEGIGFSIWTRILYD